eukprot:TRINITY_DN10887_c0_g1_i12.p2 TRINITY_DN10887_c0_g1~~TRINITY_DN10887_c0_g1_i12.p2  ORF type:complete len:318 (+),score=36.53 TRINITY_DN10887_c0_g1_i12:270-1223(+)
MVLEDRECDTATGGGYCLQTCGKCSTQDDGGWDKNIVNASTGSTTSPTSLDQDIWDMNIVNASTGNTTSPTSLDQDIWDMNIVNASTGNTTSPTSLDQDIWDMNIVNASTGNITSPADSGYVCDDYIETKGVNCRMISFLGVCSNYDDRFCRQSCGRCSVNGTNQSQADNIETQQQSANQVCNKTQNGCNCQRGRWKWDGNQDGIVEFYWGCAKTLDIDRPWCQISDASDCELEPFELTWDYCDDYCVPQNIGQCVTSQNGCDCISPWMYDGVEQSGCTRPDAEVQFSWCVIDESSCDAGHGLLNSGEVWDRCPSNC